MYMEVRISHGNAVSVEAVFYRFHDLEIDAPVVGRCGPDANAVTNGTVTVAGDHNLRLRLCQNKWQVHSLQQGLFYSLPGQS